MKKSNWLNQACHWRREDLFPKIWLIHFSIPTIPIFSPTSLPKSADILLIQTSFDQLAQKESSKHPMENSNMNSFTKFHQQKKYTERFSWTFNFLVSYPKLNPTQFNFRAWQYGLVGTNIRTSIRRWRIWCISRLSRCWLQRRTCLKLLENICRLQIKLKFHIIWTIIWSSYVLYHMLHMICITVRLSFHQYVFK